MTKVEAARGRLPSVIRYFYPMRVVGYLAILLAMAVSLRGREVNELMWAAAAGIALIWPHLAALHVRWAKNRKQAEFRNMVLDCGIAGFYISLCSFSLLPAAFIVAVGLLDCITVGGFRLALRGLPMLGITTLLSVLFFDIQFIPNTNLAGSLISLLGLYVWVIIVCVMAHYNAVRYRRSERVIQLKANQLENTVVALGLERDRAERANTVKSQFLAKVTHELRTPMNAIIGFADLALRGGNKLDRVEHLQHIQRAAGDLMSMINDVLELSQLSDGRQQQKRTAVGIQDLLDNVCDAYAAEAAAKGLDLQTEIDPKLPATVVLDGQRLARVLRILVSNSAKFTQVGSIRLRARLVSRSQESIGVLFSVEDTGVGIHSADKDRLFEPFVQADDSMTRPYGGSGLGLPIAQELVALMGGELLLESEPGQGSRFYFVVNAPIVEEQPLSVAGLPSRATVSEILRGSRILLVEDNALNRRLIEGLLAEFELELVMAANGAEAVESIERGDQYDAVLMDLQMPVMDGVSATRAIRQLRGPELLPIIAITANDGAHDRAQAAEAGMNDFIAKPVNAELLMRRLCHWVGLHAGHAA